MLVAVALAAVCLPVHAQTEPEGRPPEIVSVVVPVVGSVEGVNEVHWKTDLELRNDTRTEAEVALILPAVPEQPAILTTIPPGQSIRFTDVVGEAFGLPSALSPLIVQTRGRRSVSIVATAYGVRGIDVSRPQPIAVNYGPSYYSLRVLHGLSFSDDFRTNVGLANLGEKVASFTLALQRLPGRNLAVTRLVISPNSLVHVSIQSLFPLITHGNDFSVVIETSQTDTYVYASVIENATNSARFIQPSLGVPLAHQRIARGEQE